MKIAVFSDLHGHKYKDFDTRTEGTGSQRLDNIVNTLAFIRDDCEKRGIKYVLFAGDMFHIRSKVDTVVFNAIYDMIKTFKERGITIIGIPGNHDQHDNSDVPQHSLHTFNELDGVHIYGDLDIHFIEEEGEYVDIYCVPYSKNAQRIKDWIDSQEMLTGSSTRINLFHLGIDGGFVGSGNYPMADAFQPEDLRPNFFKYVVGGHFHKAQFLGGYNNFLYTGAPIQHSFGDEGEDKGYYILDTARRLDIKFVPIPNPKFITMSATDAVNEDMEAHAEAGNYIRIHAAEKDVQYVVTHLPPGLKYKIIIEKTYEEQSRVAVKIGMSEEDVIKTYAEKYNPVAVEVGLKILEEVKNR